MELFAPAYRRDLALLVLRLGFGAFLIVCHGIEKATSFAAKAGVFPDPIGIGRVGSLIMSMAAELGGGTLIILGLFTRLASGPLLFTLVVVATLVHRGDPWITKELAYLYAIVFLVLGIGGPGRFSLDARRGAV